MASDPPRYLATLVPLGAAEPPATLADAEALAIHVAVTAPWHPAILRHLGALPAVEPVDSPPAAEAGQVYVVAGGSLPRLPSGFQTGAGDGGVVVLEGGTDRHALATEILGRLDPELSPPIDGDPLAADFFALGAARWTLADLTTAMGHADMLDAEGLTRETLAAAEAWAILDAQAATSHLRAAFEVLTEAREKFYPVDAYLVDLCLLDKSTPAGALDDALAARAPFTLIAPAEAIEALAGRDPGAVERLRTAIDEGWADVAGGAYAEVDETLRPLGSIAWQYTKGAEVYRRHLDERGVETFARRRFGLYPQLPQVARRVGLRFAVHLGLDAGGFPVPAETKRLWEAPDGSQLESLTRPPLAADRDAAGLALPWRLARSMRDDHVTVVPIVHWPSPVALWYRDLRRVAAYSPVLMRWSTLGDFFHRTDRPWDAFRPGDDLYKTPYLDQAVARGDDAPIGGRARHARLRSRLDAIGWMDAVGVGLSGVVAEPLSADELETGALDAAASAIGAAEVARGSTFAAGIVGTGAGRPGFLVANSLGFARRAGVFLPGEGRVAVDGPVKAAQRGEAGTWAVVDLPAFGYAWVGADASTSASVGKASAAGRSLRNEHLRLEVDEATGGLRAFSAAAEPTARLGQRLVAHGIGDSAMRAESFAVDLNGPALAQATSAGTLVAADGTRLASFRQRYRLWSGRPIAELQVTLADVDPSIRDGNRPWDRYLGCRWAWPDANVMLRRTCLLAPMMTDAERPETPDALDISTRRQRSAMLVGGLAHHRRHGPRMLDTLLVAGREATGVFELAMAAELEHPYQASHDLLTPPIVVPTASGPPRAGPVGWFFRIDNPSVACWGVEAVDERAENRGPGIAFNLVETAGSAARCRIRLFRPPGWARQTDLTGELIVDLTVDGDAVLVDLTPHEILRVVISVNIGES